MKRSIPLICILFPALLCSLSAKSQFYYTDILAHQGNLQQYQLHKSSRVQAVQITSYENSGEKSPDFKMQQQYNSSWSQLKTIAELAAGGRNVVTNYYNGQGLLYRTTDSSNGNYLVYEYFYDSLSRLVQIQNNSMAIGEKNKSSETHNWFYDAQGKPEKMMRIRDKTDTMYILLKKDSSGQITEEQTVHKGVAGEKTYYYYDEQNKLSDIVRYSDRAGKLIPDYLFDYDEKGRLSQMVTVQQAGTTAVTWVYKYNELGLKEEETCYLSQKKLAGRMAYQYSFKK